MTDENCKVHEKLLQSVLKYEVPINEMLAKLGIAPDDIEGVSSIVGYLTARLHKLTNNPQYSTLLDALKEGKVNDNPSMINVLGSGVGITFSSLSEEQQKSLLGCLNGGTPESKEKVDADDVKLSPDEKLDLTVLKSLGLADCVSDCDFFDRFSKLPQELQEGVAKYMCDLKMPNPLHIDSAENQG